MRGYRAVPYHLFSLGIHALLFALVFTFTGTELLSGPKEKAISKKMRVIGKAIKVDVVAMPKMTIQELKKMAPAPGKLDKAPAKKVTSKGGDENTVFKKENKKKSFADMLKELSQRKVKKAKAQPQKKAQKTAQDSGAGGFKGKNLSKILALGNKLSEGNSYTGGAGSNSGDIFDTYATEVSETVRQWWKLPGYLMNKNLSCRVQIYISSRGKLLKYRVIESSGNKDYDDRAVRALQRVGSFPIPQKEIAARVAAGDIALAFPL
ncbi:energy transducer TonB [Bacteriovorax sp. DB6_IX]|uniref:energy transducer TonB n=1 Tax=Bacteriovorax sp. DB6_IX TaxID=1353530 RepID=UPI00038A11B3|nr:TonB family protein [Bacteriovorax sp. DB6_IX]EQC50684.1 TonB family C-terminal domain protein [Bacteriovorax sp. DB6_IX]